MPHSTATDPLSHVANHPACTPRPLPSAYPAEAPRHATSGCARVEPSGSAASSAPVSVSPPSSAAALSSAPESN
eukprot:469223-Prymnesium_polylepis.1